MFGDVTRGKKSAIVHIRDSRCRVTRDTIFISHATPDDNEFVRWLGARLMGHGYKVWSDVLELKGGTPFWRGIEEALRHRAIKVIYVVSKASIDPNRQGVRNELSVADTMKKTLTDPEFIIPVSRSYARDGWRGLADVA